MRARRSAGAGPFLFGRFSAADAMFAPVVNRLHIYDVRVKKATRDYMDAIMALPAWKAWIKDAEAETWRIEKYDPSEGGMGLDAVDARRQEVAAQSHQARQRQDRHRGA